jgi:uncharacterized protein YjbI with pentapeptide repeats
MPNICTYPSCNLKALSPDPSHKCYFHDDKKSSYTEDSLGNKKWNTEFVQIFWKEIRNKKIAKNDFDFSNFIFPLFEEFKSSIVEETGTGDEKKYRLKKDWNFWSIDQDIAFFSKAVFRGAIFTGKSSFVAVAFMEGADFTEAIFHEPVKFNLSNFDRGNFFLTYFYESVFFNHAIFQNGASFRDALFKKRCYIENVTFRNTEGDTSFNGTLFEDVVSFNGSQFDNETYFSGTEFQNIAVFYSVTGNTLHFDFIKLGRQSLLDFSMLNLKILKMTTVQNISAVIRFTDSKINNKFILNDTAFGTSELNNFDISQCSEIIIKASSFLKTMFNNINWGRITEDRFAASRDVYRQLKYVLEQQGNFIESNRFYSLEMKEYKKELEAKPLSIDTWQDKVIFFMHEKVSNFSQSWFLPILWFFDLGIILTIFKKIHLKSFNPFSVWELLTPTLIIIGWIIGKGLSNLKERFRYYQLDIIVPSFILISLFLFSIQNPLNEFAKVINPFGVFKDSESYRGIEFAWFIHKSLMAFVVYQFVVTLRMQTRRK